MIIRSVIRSATTIIGQNRKAPVRIAIALLRGSLYAAYFRIFRTNVRIRLPFLAYAPVKIVGPGSVFIDRRCAVHLNSFEGLTIATLAQDATVRIGQRCMLGGMTIRCRKRIEIADNVMSANCLLQDALFGSGAPATSVDPTLTAPADVYVGSRAWLTVETIVLGGTHVGENSVLSLSSVHYQSIVPSGHVAFGNLSYNSLSIEGLDGLRKA